MSYAPNPTSADNESYAPLTAGLLARKGQAMPAVDAHAHAGVDIDMRPLRPATEAARDLPEKTIGTLKKPAVRSAAPPRARSEAPERRPAPDAWTIAAPQSTRASISQPAPRVTLKSRTAARRNISDEAGLKATITFKMPARDFIRMRMSAKDLELTCQALLLEALDCYLEANDIAPLSDEDYEREVARLTKMMKARRSAASAPDDDQP